MGCTVTFGEVMLRLEPPGHDRLAQRVPGTLVARFAGAEANVAVGVSQLGAPARFVSAVPDNPISDALSAELRKQKVDISHLTRIPDSRMGLFFTERGAAQRPSLVVYDRAGSAFATTPSQGYAWDSALDGASWFHTTGITPAVSRAAAAAARDAVRAARAAGFEVSVDLNYRGKLWKWDGGDNARELARKTMPEILSSATVIIGNEQDASDVLGISPDDTDVERGDLSHGAYGAVAREISSLFPNARYIAFTLRESISASHNRWGAMLYAAESDEVLFAPGSPYEPYDISPIVDRVGAGDAFSAGLIWALQSDAYREPQSALNFAAAYSCLAHSVDGDFCICSRAEVERLLATGGSGRVVR